MQYYRVQRRRALLLPDHREDHVRRPRARRLYQGWGGEDVRLIDLFYKGGETIRGFNRGGFGPRDLNTGDALGGDTFWSATAEVRFPLPFIPEDLGMSGAAFADAGSLFGAGACAKNPANAGCEAGNTNVICLADSSVGACFRGRAA